MKYASSIAKYSDFRPANVRENRRRTGKRTATVRAKWQNIAPIFHRVLCNITLMVITTTLFLGGSYLFFVQLAEYGW